MRRSLVPMFLSVLDECEKRSGFGVDARLWSLAKASGLKCDEYDDMPVIGVKGLPGCAGLGVGHRPNATWHDDTELKKLRQWVGADAEVYAGLLPR